VPKEKLPIKQAVYFDVPDGRMIFAIPRGRTTYIGTTDTDYTGDIESVSTTKEDAEYLLHAVNETFPSVRLDFIDIESSWAGLRPLIHEDGKSASELSRKDEIFISPSGLISIAGGKLTGYRKMAERVIDLVIKKHFEDKTLQKCNTAKVQLLGAEFVNAKEVIAYLNRIETQLKPYDLEYRANYLVSTYGRQTNLIIDNLAKQSVKNDLALAKAELWYGVNHEMVVTPVDFFVRRTGMLFFDIIRLKIMLDPILEEFKKTFSWNEEKAKFEKKVIDSAISEAALKV
jgi:glycerol-3-phosphate dehydrogenase